jgi:uncharacterized protein YukE
MTQAIANPEQIERFAHELKAYNERLREMSARLQGGFHQLGETWRDQEHVKFAQQFEQTMKVIHAFNQAADQQIPYLLRKAQRLRDYLQQH